MLLTLSELSSCSRPMSSSLINPQPSHWVSDQNYNHPEYRWRTVLIMAEKTLQTKWSWVRRDGSFWSSIFCEQCIPVDLLAFAIDNPAPATIILISGDRDFAYAVSVLRLRHYRVVIVAPTVPSPHISLKSQASIFLEWETVILGKRKSVENLSSGPQEPSDCSPDTRMYSLVSF